MTALTAMDKLLFWLGIGTAQKGSGSKEVNPSRHWVVSLVVGSSSRRREGTTVKRCHMNVPDFIKAWRPSQQHRRPSTPNASPLAELL
jgi:hypothetical protein